MQSIDLFIVNLDWVFTFSGHSSYFAEWFRNQMICPFGFSALHLRHYNDCYFNFRRECHVLVYSNSFVFNKESSHLFSHTSLIIMLMEGAVDNMYVY